MAEENENFKTWKEGVFENKISYKLLLIIKFVLIEFRLKTQN